MIEVELKIQADHGLIRDRLDDLDATTRGRVRQIDTYYAAPHRQFEKTDEALRLRAETSLDTGGEKGRDTVSKLTYKGPKIDSKLKTRTEHESHVSDSHAVDGLLQALGFEPAGEVRKDRDRYFLGDCLISLDTVDNLGEFVEIERDVEGQHSTGDSRAEPANNKISREFNGPTQESIDSLPDSPLERTGRSIDTVLQRLGIEPDESIRTSYLELLDSENRNDETN